MNHALAPISVSSITARRPAASRPQSRDASVAAAALAASREWANNEETARLKRLRSLLALFSLYATALLTVIVLSDGADVGCILAGISGHVFYATYRMVASWRDASWLENARGRMLLRRRTT